MCILDLSLLLIICTCICSEIAHVDVTFFFSSPSVSFLFWCICVCIVLFQATSFNERNAFLVAFQVLRHLLYCNFSVITWKINFDWLTDWFTCEANQPQSHLDSKMDTSVRKNSTTSTVSESRRQSMKSQTLVLKKTHMQFLAARSRWTNLRLDR